MPTRTDTNDKTTQKPVKRRNRLATMERILRATGELMAEVGTAQSGINGVAQRAGVNKVLIYRYFGGWNGLVEAFVQRGFFLTIISERGIDAISTPISPSDRLQHWQHTLRGILCELRTRPAARALLRWELDNGQTELANRLACLRNDAFQNVITKLSPARDIDVAGLMAILWGGLVYLVLASEQRPTIIDVVLSEDAGWQRIELAMDCLLLSVIDHGSA